ncbi:6-phosphogluconolactonase [Prochlorococcus marinus str. MIT 9107]|uniref:6-phosphogluconolactonase n=2 Tax=Prochlorococcaceae TaxID=2881426 RepID=A0A0A1ZPV3_PROMR|nr:6-phosphogluconolactonase [Prochlorococcus marinus]KGF89701.1 6-phosphogluconolactonase [Prochlorococcus marinus str. MIT 9107]KGF90289.1 6-phosphogluconolactonase [Prochlorococcus marinus str. MIT 9116]
MIEKIINGYTLNIYKDKLKLSTAVFKFIERQIFHTLKKKDRFKFCVSGGSTPKSVYKLLSKSDLRWNMVDVFLGDERCVDPNSELSNSLMLKNSLLTNLGSGAFFYEILNDLKADEEAIKNLFISKLFEKCGSNPPSFDLTLLGLGDDGHTASLFPYQKNNVDDFVIFSEGKGLKRISLTPRVLSASSKIIFLVSGASKKLALERLLDEKESPDRTPSKLIKSTNQISIFCDQESAKDLKI